MGTMADSNAALTDIAARATQERILALQEYLAVAWATSADQDSAYKAGLVQELHSDIRRLQGWNVYLLASAARPLWWRMLTSLAMVMGSFLRRPVKRRRQFYIKGHGQTAVQHIPSYSLVDRAYTALQDDLHGQKLTLQFRQRQRGAELSASDVQKIENLNQQIALLQDARDGLNEWHKRVPVVTATLGWYFRLSSGDSAFRSSQNLTNVK